MVLGAGVADRLGGTVLVKKRDDQGVCMRRGLAGDTGHDLPLERQGKCSNKARE